jgi:hypothetical protein
VNRRGDVSGWRDGVGAALDRVGESDVGGFSPMARALRGKPARAPPARAKAPASAACATPFDALGLSLERPFKPAPFLLGFPPCK